jgi:hypothetical protein
MKTIEITLYKFNELNETAQAHAIENNRHFNVDYEWWNCTYDDALNVGLEINGFDLDRSKHCTGKLISSGSETSNLILDNHGEKSDTYILAKEFKNKWSKLVTKHSDGVKLDKVTEEREYEFDNLADDMEYRFLNDLLALYADMLEKEYEWLIGDECIKESLIANDYDFLQSGARY